MAKLDGKLDAVLLQLVAIRKETEDHEQRIRGLERNERLEARLRAVEECAKVNRERLSIFSGLQAAFTAIAAGVAGWFGSRY